MIHPLNGAKLKIVRAQEHLDSLNAEIGMYVRDNVYSLVTNQHENPSESTTDATIRIPPPLRLSTLIGDCVNNARAALDYVVWELAQRFFVPSFNVKDFNDRRIVAFPIRLGVDDQGFTDRLDRLEQRGIPTAAISEIQQSQTHDSTRDTLVWLHQLGNTDKHRMPLLTVGQFNSFTISGDRSAHMKLMIGETTTEVVAASSLTLYQTAERIAFSTSAMQVNTQATICVSFQDVTMPAEPVDRTLSEIIKTVANVIPRFDRFF